MDESIENVFQLRILESFPEPDFTALRTAAFADFGVPSNLLADVLADEATRRSQASGPEPGFPEQFRVGAFTEDQLVGWSYSRIEGSELHMVNSGTYPEFRRRGIYSALVKATISYATSRGFQRIISRHVPSNNAVIIPKLRLGFMVSAFEYSEVYGPLVQLTYLVGLKRRDLYQTRSKPIVPSGSE